MSGVVFHALAHAYVCDSSFCVCFSWPFCTVVDEPVLPRQAPQMFAFGCNSTLIRQHPTITTTPIQTKLPSTDVAHRNNGQKGRRNHEDPFFTTPRQHFALRRPFKMESVVSICVTAARGRSDKSSIWLLEENLTLSYFCSIWIAYHDDRERMAAIPLFSRL